MLPEDDSVWGYKLGELVGRQRAVLVNQPGAGGLRLVAKAALGLSSLHQRPVSVLAAPDRLVAWSHHFPPSETHNVNLVSAVAQARRPELLGPSDVLVVDGTGLTTNQDTVSWRAFSPVLRKAEFCLLYVSRSSWPGCLRLVELVDAFDRVVTLELSDFVR